MTAACALLCALFCLCIGRNPAPRPPLARAQQGANFIHKGGGVGPQVLSNDFVGKIGGFAVANAALSAAEIRAVCQHAKKSIGAVKRKLII